MLYAKNNEIFSLCAAVKYAHEKSFLSDYSTEPRPCHNIAFILQGRVRVYEGDNTVSLRAGDVLFIPKNATYKAFWEAEEKVVFHSIHFNFQPQCDPFSGKRFRVQGYTPENFDELYSLIESFQKNQYMRDVNSFFALADFYRLCGHLFSCFQYETNPQQETAILPALKYIEHNYTTSVTVEYLASLCFLSPSRFFFLFKKQTEKSPIAYKNNVCIRHAAQALLLHKEKSVEEISLDYGFESAVYFRRLFKRLTGKSPTQYRKEHTFL